jgi:hypothetical protein
MGKKLLLLGLVFVVVGVWTPNVFAFGYIGQPTAELNKGQWSAGFNYSYSTQDLDTTKMKWSELEYGDFADDPAFGSFKMENKDFDTQRYLGRIVYGLNDSWEVYGQLGGADVKGKFREVGDTDWDDTSINFDNDFTWGWGTKITFAKQPKTNWGVALQMNWLNTSWSDKGSDEWDGVSESWQETVDLDTWDLVIAVGPTVDMGGWKLYGGPFYYYLSGDYDRTEKGTWTADDFSGGWIEKESGDLEADSNFGGYIGAQVDISKTCNASLEFSATGDGWGAGAGLTFLCK